MLWLKLHFYCLAEYNYAKYYDFIILSVIMLNVVKLSAGVPKMLCSMTILMNKS